MYKLYGIPNCDSVRKARIFLEHNSIPYEFINYKTDPADKALINNWMKQRHWDEILNKKSATYRALTPAEKESVTTASRAQQLILKHNSLIKRPVITRDDQIVAIGFDEAAYPGIFKAK